MSDSTSPAARRRALAARRRELLRRTLAAEGFTPSGDGAGESAGDGPVTGAVGRGRGDDAALPPSSATPARTGEVTDRRISTRLAGDPRDATGMLTWVFDVPGDAETGERIRRAAVAVAAARPRLRTTVGLPATAAAPDATAPDPAAPGVERAVLPATAVVEPRADHPEPTTAAALARHAVDPSSEPPLRVRTLPAPDRPGRADLVISTHHCAADEHTWVLLLDGLGTALAGGTPAASTGVTGEDATPELVDTAARRRAEALRGVPVGPDRPDPFAADRGRADTASRRVELPVDAAWADALRRGAREAGTTPPAVLVDAAARVLARRGAGDVPVVGTPADVRVMLGAGAWDDDGDRVSVIPVAVDTRCPVADGFAAVQEAVRDRCAGLDDVLRVLDLPTSPDRHALVDAVVTHRSGRRTLTLDGGEVTGTYAACGASAFDLVLALEDDGTGAGGAVLSAEARCSAPGPDVARLILAEWRDAVARSVGAEGSAGTGAEGPASPGEVGGTTPTAAAPVTAAPGSGSPVGGAGSAPVDVAAAVARAARDAATAGAVAVSCGGRTLTYAQLDRAVDATVGVLRDAGARPGDVVALRLHRGAGVPVAMLAALRAGTPFVAVDPGQPAGRAAAVLAAADPRAGIDDATVEAVLDGVRDAAPGGATDGSADTVAAAPAAAGTPAPGSAASSPSDGATHPDSPAYLVFTSGTTGTPKGVTVPRRGLDAVLGAAVDMLCHGPGVTSLAGSTLGFDISVVEMLGALAAGGRVHVAPATFASDPAAAVAELRAVRPHIVEATPSLWSEILACDPTVVRGVLACAGGEALPAATATGLRAAGADVLNLYGPSETSVIATAHRVTGDGTPPLGAVLPGLRAEVLDARLRPVPDGAVGELYLSGPQVALGYLGAPGTTAAAFVAGPGGRRRYRTGDLVSRRVPDGAVRFHGRADDQLSLRGLRIELAEVEAALTAAPAVAAAAVRVAGGPGREVLLGYVVTTDTAADPVPGIRAALTATLPSGARPARITVLDHLPRNANGKVDRAALPVPADLGADTGAGPDAVGGGHPTPTERTVTAAVRDVLGLADTPPTGADVRSLGGHSLLAHRLALRLSADLGVTVPAREVLADGTLADLARTCDDLIAAGGPGTPATGDAAAGPGPTGGVAASSPDHPDTPGPVDPLPGQRRIVTAEALDDTPGLYTLPVIVECDTAPAPAVLGRALQEVCRRHPVLRTRPRLDGGRVVSTLLAAADVPAPPVTALTTTRELTPVVLRDLLATPFTAADGPVRAAVVTRRDAPPVVALLLHHAWADEWSLGPFFADLAAALGAEGRHDGDAGDPGHGSTAGRPEGPSYAAVRDALGAGSAQDRAFWAGRRHALAPAETPLPFSRSSRPDGAARGAGDAPTGAGAGGTTGAGGDVHLTATVPAPGLARGDAATVVRAAVLLLLDRAGAEPVVGVPVAGRHDARLLDVVGYLGNTLPVTVGDPGRGVLAPGAPVRGVVDAVRAEVTDVALRSSVPLEELTDGGVPFRVLVDHRVGDVPVPDVPGWNARPVDPPTVPAKFPLTVMVTEPGADPVAAGHDDSGARDDAADMRLDLLFSGAEFDADGARSFAAALRRVVRTVARAVTATAGDDRAPGRREPCVADVALGTVPATVTTPEGTGRAATLARRHGVAAAVDDALRRCRDLPVLTGRGETLTGGQVLAATAAVADAVTDAVGGPDGTTGTVAVHLGARRDEVLALLGVLRTGRPFTVLRQDDPPGRLSAALADAQVTAVLTDRPGLLTGAVAEGVVVVPLPGLPGTGTDPAPGTTRDLGAVPVPARPADGDPAYVCFTSGTTGRPKGVMVGHGALAGLLDVSDAVFAPDGDAALARGVRPRFVSVAPMHFDVGVLEVLATLTTGGHLLVADDADRVGTALVRTVTRHRATHMSVTPTVLAGLGDPAGIGEDVVVFSGAEPLPVDLALAWADRHQLINLYGPTEATVNALHGDVDPATVRRTGTVPVGEADPGTAALVLDAALRPVPDGMPGELWLAGTGLALGYPASPGLTAARFTAVPDEWGLAPGARMYRTGDLAVRAADGTVTCTGRIDDQFKIRGLRVEPGDIEAAFRADGRVAAAVAVPVAGRRDTLAAGVVPAAGTFTDADLEELRRGVARVLPRYLVPQRVVAVAALPVTPNGKTDRRQAARDVAAALEAGGGVAGTAAAATVATGGAAPAAAAPVDGAAAPDDPALAALVTALTAVLDPGSGVPTAEDSVLGLGGDSIGALEIVARLRDAGWTVAPRDVLDAPTLAALAATMRRTGGGADGSDGPDDGAARAAADADATATAPGAPGDAADAAGIAPTGRFTPGRVAGEFVAESPEALLTQTMLLAVPSSAVGRVAGMVERLVDLHPALRTRTVTGAGGVDPVVDRTTDPTGPTTGPTGPTDPTTDPTDPTPVPLCETLPAGTPGTLHVHPPVTATGPDAADTIADLRRELDAALDVTAGRLTAVAEVETDAGPAVALTVHHLAVDAASWSRLIADLRALAGGRDPGPAGTSPRAGAVRTGAAGPSPEVPGRSGEGADAALTPPTARIASGPVGPGDTAATAERDVLTVPAAVAGALVARHGTGADLGRAVEEAVVAAVRAVDPWGPAAVAVDVEGHGRGDGVDPRAVGWWTRVTTRRHVAAGASAGGAGAGVDGADAATVVETVAERPVPRDRRADVLLNHLGTTGTVADPGAFTPLALPGVPPVDAGVGPDTPLRSALTVTSSVTPAADGPVLSLTLVRATRLVPAATAAAFRGHVLAALADGVGLGGGSAGLTVLPVTPTQEGLVLIDDAADPGAAAYVVRMAFTVSGLRDARALARAWRRLGDRHPALAATFHRGRDGRVRAVSGPGTAPSAEIVDGPVAAGDPAATPFDAPFDLARGPLARLRVTPGSDGRHRVEVALHHVIADGWSAPVIMRDLFALLAADARPADPAATDPAATDPAARVDPVPALAAVTARRHPDRRWRRLLRDARPTALAPGGTDDGTRADTVVTLDPATTRGLAAVARERRTTVAALLHGAWAVVTAARTGQSGVTSGSVVSGRPTGVPGAAEAVGMFAATVPVAVRGVDPAALDAPDPAVTARAVADAARGAAETLRLAADVPPSLAAVQALSGPARASGEALFDSLVVVENYPLDPAAVTSPVEGVTVSDLRYTDGSHYPVMLVVNPGERLRLRLAVAGGVTLASGAAPEEVLDDLARACRAVAGTSLPPDRMGAPPLSGPAPLLAAEGAAVRWSAAEAARAVDALAAHLLDRGAAPGVTVGVALPRGVEQVCSVLAVWRTGGAVMPLEVDGNGVLTPRSGEILARSGATLLLDRNTVTNVLVEGVAGGRAASTPGPRRRRHLDPGDPAYVIHTSGTTGDPKGVTVPWRVLDGLLRHQVAQGVPAPGDVLAHLAPDQFDVAVQEVATAALGGHRLVVVDDATRRDTAALARVLDDEGVDVVFATTTLLDALAAHHARTGAPVLRTLVQAGERLDPGAHLRAWCTAPDGPVLRNDYGPTETHVCLSTVVDPDVLRAGGPVPVGEALPHVTAAVLGPDLAPVADGVTGELYIAGDVADGYAGDPALTATRFVAAPGGGRWHRTGDLARRGAGGAGDGAVVVLGRADDQAKIHGVRVHPAEVAAVARRVPGVGAAVAVVVDGRLCLAVTGSGDDAACAPEDVRRALEAWATGDGSGTTGPALVPAEVLVVDALPTGATGKADRRAVADLFRAGRGGGPAGGGAAAAASVAPTTPTTPTTPTAAAALPVTLAASALRRVLVEDGTLPEDREVGPADDIVALGGSSLSAVRWAARVSAVLGTPVTVRTVMEERTPARVAAAVAGGPRAGHGGDAAGQGTGHGTGAGAAATAPEPVRRPAPDTPLEPTAPQRRFWALSRVDPAGVTYTLPLLAEFTADPGTAGTATAESLAAAVRDGLAALVRRHESLRTLVTGGTDGPRQVIVDPDSAVDMLDVAVLPPGEEVTDHRRRPFRLDRELPVRAAVASTGPGRALVSLVFHHVAVDGWSLPVVVDDLAAVWSASSPTGATGRPVPAGAPAEPPIPAPSPAAITAAQDRWRTRSGTADRDLAFWRETLADLPCPMPLPLDRPRSVPGEDTPGGRLLRIPLPPAEADRLVETARALDATPFMLLHAAVAAVLSRMGCGEDIVVTTPESGRSGAGAALVADPTDPVAADLSTAVGCFVNLLVLRVSLAGDPEVREIVDRVRAAGLAAVEHAGTPFEDLVRELAAGGVTGHHPLATVGVGVQTFPAGLPAPRGWSARVLDDDPGVSRFDLNVDLVTGSGEACLAVEFDTALFDTRTVRRLIDRVRRVLATAAEAPGTRLSRLPVLLDDERLRLPAVPAPTGHTATGHTATGTGDAGGRRRADLVRGVPTAGAVVGPDGRRIPADELRDRVDTLARDLVARGVRPGDVVAVSCDRDAGLVVAQLAVLRTGAAYVPLIPGTPEERRRVVLAETGAGVVLTSGDVRDVLSGATATATDAGATDAGAGTPALPDPADIPGDLPAYVLFTSGSTGRPKGVTVTRDALGALLVATNRAVPLGADDVFLAVSPFGFDIAGWELLAPLAGGAALVVADEDERRDPDAILGLVRRHGVTVCEATPGLWSLLAEAAARGHAASTGTATGTGAGVTTGPLHGLRALAGGEELPRAVAEALAGVGAQVWNLYGPTEVTVIATAGPWTGGRPDIGTPLPGVTAVVLDDRLAPVPEGALGELYLSGPQVAAGYLGAPAGTAAAFVADPWGAGTVMYRTGDLVRRRADGTFHYEGRRDGQVQVRGHRVEPAEVTSALLRQRGVRAAAVRVLDRGGATTLVGYAVTDRPATDPAVDPTATDPGTSPDLLAALRRELPEYLVPSQVVTVAELPVTANGKVDVDALPLPPAARWEAPRPGTERTLAEIVAELLDIDVPGRHDGFLALGGDSITAVRLAARATEVGLALGTADVVRAGTIAELADTADRAAAGRPEVGDDAHPSATADSTGATATAGGSTGAGAEDGVDTPAPTPTGGTGGSSPVGDLSGLSAGDLDRVAAMFGGFAPGVAPGSGPGSADPDSTDPDSTDPGSGSGGPGVTDPHSTDPDTDPHRTEGDRT